MELKIEKICERRNIIMGFAAFLILLCHNTVHFQIEILNDINRIFIQHGCQIGVDIFLFCSGMGCMFSFSNNKDVLRFYNKRLRRILPIYVIIIIPWSLLCVLTKTMSIGDALYRYSFVGFFSEGLLDEWYIIATLILYFIFPVLYDLSQKSVRVQTGGVLICTALTIVLPHITHNRAITAQNAVFFTRLPMFFLGMVVAELNVRKKEFLLSKRFMAGLLVGGVICYVICDSTPGLSVLVHYCFVPISAVFIICIANNECRGERIWAKLAPVTLELYLLQDKVRIIFEAIMKRMFMDGALASFFCNVLAMLCTILIALLLHNVYQKIVGYMKRDA